MGYRPALRVLHSCGFAATAHEFMEDFQLRGSVR